MVILSVVVMESSNLNVVQWAREIIVIPSRTWDSQFHWTLGARKDTRAFIDKRREARQKARLEKEEKMMEQLRRYLDELSEINLNFGNGEEMNRLIDYAMTTIEGAFKILAELAPVLKSLRQRLPEAHHLFAKLDKLTLSLKLHHLAHTVNYKTIVAKGCTARVWYGPWLVPVMIVGYSIYLFLKSVAWMIRMTMMAMAGCLDGFVYVFGKIICILFVGSCVIWFLLTFWIPFICDIWNLCVMLKNVLLDLGRRIKMAIAQCFLSISDHMV